jgi:hypothetical protein
MRTPVYRHLDARGGLFGLSVLEWAPILFIAWSGMALDRPNQGVLIAVAVYAGLRVVGHGRPDGFLQAFVSWRWRQGESGGRLSAAARGRAPRFPFAEYEFRDVRASSAGEGRVP